MIIQLLKWYKKNAKKRPVNTRTGLFSHCHPYRPRSRNQEKLAYAESEYMDTDKVVTKKIEALVSHRDPGIFFGKRGRLLPSGND